MDNKQNFVETLHTQQKKQEKNKRSQGKGHPDKVLPNNQH
ncbi:DUF4023 family protein [Ectobacillus antri]|jgi:hypothetical protein|uniref:DUF4023 family protein n=1 Tax=Ectobacillus antri TaxID=2486280 RepID=A0ABT6HAB9_9BACI|nr:DUF4023 family protein [Ectobacillus antri]MDG4658215.1 DUF4023 family protein [Ectobacillus antri]MDG5755301.1 DUF4023 family protein [Ectobacillus antri]